MDINIFANRLLLYYACLNKKVLLKSKVLLFIQILNELLEKERSKANLNK